MKVEPKHAALGGVGGGALLVVIIQQLWTGQAKLADDIAQHHKECSERLVALEVRHDELRNRATKLEALEFYHHGRAQEAAEAAEAALKAVARE